MSRNHQPNSIKLLQELREFTGDILRYRHGLNHSLYYTPGIRHLANKAGAYWLVDAIASHVGSPLFRKAMQQDERLQYLQFWKLTVASDGTADLAARADSGVKPFIKQAIPYTDFPLDEIDLWLGTDGKYWTLYLPSEH